MTVFLIIFNQETLLLSRNFARLVNNLVFFAVFLTLFFLLNQKDTTTNFLNSSSELALNSLVCGTIFAILTSILIYFSDFLQRDSEDGTLEQLSLVCQNFEIIILAKILANWFASCFGMIFAGGILAFGLTSDLALSLKLIAVLLIMSFSLSCICAFCGHLGSFSNSLALSAILAFPLCIPSLLIAHLAITSEFFANFWLLLAIAILAANIAIFGSAKLIKIETLSPF